MKTVRNLMHSPVVTISPDENLRKAWRMMHDHHFRQLPVVIGDRLVGILTDRDIRQHVIYLEDRAETGGSSNDALETLVDGVMTRDVKPFHPDDTLDDALNLFISEKFGGAPVVEGDDQLIGILTYIDVLRECRRMLQEK